MQRWSDGWSRQAAGEVNQVAVKVVNLRAVSMGSVSPLGQVDQIFTPLQLGIDGITSQDVKTLFRRGHTAFCTCVYP